MSYRPNLPVAVATSGAAGIVRPDNTTLTVDGSGTASVVGVTVSGLTAASSLVLPDLYVVNQAGVDVKATGAQVASLVRSTARRSASASFGMGATVAAGTIYVPIPNAATILSLSADANFGGSQTFTVAASIGGTTITGMGGLSVTGGAAASATATAANTVTAGQEVALVFSSPANSPTGGTVTLTWQE